MHKSGAGWWKMRGMTNDEVSRMFARLGEMPTPVLLLPELTPEEVGICADLWRVERPRAFIPYEREPVFVVAGCADLLGCVAGWISEGD